MALSPGDKLGTFEILSLIGKGGMGEVYRARDTKLKREIALKVLPQTLERDPERMTRFRREAEVLASLNHPNIATIHGVEGSALVMELVDGESPRGPMPFADAWRIAGQIAAALEYAHDKGVVHRDLKPANMMVTPDGVVKLLDFGLAKAWSAQTAASTGDPENSPTLTLGGTQMGVILGTAAYMAPEQAKGKSVDKRADIWAFGVVLYELLTGERLFKGDDASDILAQVLTKEPDLSRVPSQARNLLRCCLEKDPKKRLRDIGDAPSLLAEPTGPPTSKGASRWAWGFAGTLALALVASVGAPWRPLSATAFASQFVILPPDKGNFSPDAGSEAISPDGRLLVFAASRSGGTTSLWLRPLDSLTARPLAGTDDAIQPFWCPDSRSIGFFAHGKLQTIALAGGPPQILADASFPFGGTWNNSGVIVFAPRLGSLYRVPAGGGENVPVTHPDGGLAHVNPSFLPDGRHFLFVSAFPRSENVGLYMGSLDSKDTKQVLRGDLRAQYSPPGYLMFLRESTLMAQPFDLRSLSASGEPAPVADHVGGFSVSNNQTVVYKPGLAAQNHLVWVDRSGKQLLEAAPPGDYSNIALSDDEKHLAFDGSDTNQFDVSLLDLEHHVRSRFTFQASNVPIWSPNGATLVFASIGQGLDLSQRPSNMSSPEHVLLKLNAPPILFPSDWSRDGKYLVYYRTDAETQLDLWVLPMFGDPKPFVFLHGKSNESQGQFSPDGKWMAYVSDETGSPQINVVAFPTPGGVRQVSTAGGMQPRWSHDGKELFYVALDRKLMAVTVKTDETFEAPRVLFETTLPATPLRQMYAVSRDGQQFLLTVPVEVASPPLTLLENWTSTLKN